MRRFLRHNRPPAPQSSRRAVAKQATLSQSPPVELTQSKPFDSVMQFSTTENAHLLERCRSGRSGRSRKPLYPYGYPGFESLSFRNLRRQNSAFKQQTADYQIVLRFFVSYPFNSGLKYSKGLCQYFWFYNSNALSFSRKSYIPMVVIPASLRRMIMSLPTTIIFLNESSTFLKDDSSCRILFSSSIWYAD